LLVALLLGLPGLLTAQTPVTSLGLGYPVPSLDGRAAALGGTGLGLLGGSFSSRNPADLNLFVAPAIGATLAPEAVDVKTSAGDQSVGRSRMAVVQAALPLREWTFGLNINAELDQDWDVLFADTLETGFGNYPYLERRQHDGGLSSVGLAIARRFGVIGFGLEGSALTGQLRQVFSRSFEPAIEDPLNVIGGALGESRWAFSGWRLRAGALAEFGGRAVLSASATLYTDLEADKDTFNIRVETRKFELPVELSIGGSARIGDRFLLALGAGWQGWSSTDFKILPTESADVVWMGGGLEFAGVSLMKIAVPLRIGYRYADLPFYEEGFAQLSETAFTFGLGAWISGGRAILDLGVEIGSRGDLPTTGVEESFRRISLSLGIVSR
jgi:hypothetical protein